NSYGITKIEVVARSAVAGHPLLLSGTIVLDRGIIKIGPRCTDAGPRDIDIARSINCDGASMIIVIRRSVVPSNPLLLSRGVVLDRRIIITIQVAAAWPNARSRHIDIA